MDQRCDGEAPPLHCRGKTLPPHFIGVYGPWLGPTEATIDTSAETAQLGYA